MLTIGLKILSIIGILLLVFFLLILSVLLLVLFCPFTYQVSGGKDAEGFRLKAKVKWLLGLIRFRYEYPEPGELTAKVLFFTLFKMKIPPEAEEDNEAKSESAGFFGKRFAETKEKIAKKADNFKEGSAKRINKKGVSENSTDIRKHNDILEKKNSDVKISADAVGESVSESATETPAEGEAPPLSFFEKILRKFEKIKYTIHSIYDKIKEIWNNISYYLALLQEEETRQFFSHIRLRTGRMLKSVLPRHIRAQILFGTGSPDTTGYLYGGYCMVAPVLKGDINVTPDFEKPVLEADFCVSGHIIIWTLAVNTGRILLDKRLRHLIRKLKSPKGNANHKKETQKKAA